MHLTLDVTTIFSRLDCTQVNRRMHFRRRNK